jgi:cell division septum initiation protein DivIVA
MRKRITVAFLRKHKACKHQVDLFASVFPDEGADISRENILTASTSNLNIDWLARRILKASALAEYRRVTTSARAEYQRVTAPALAEYQRVTATALAEYERVKASALAEHRRVTAPAYAEYRRAKASALADALGL